GIRAGHVTGVQTCALPISYAICATCTPNGPQATWARITGVSSPSVSGSSTRHDIGGTTQYADVLWNNHLIGDFSSQGFPDFSKRSEERRVGKECRPGEGRV